MTSDEEKTIRLDERERVFAEIQRALRCIRFGVAALKVEEWKAISDGFQENAAASTATDPDSGV